MKPQIQSTIKLTPAQTIALTIIIIALLTSL